MCTRFVHNGLDVINGFDFDIDLSVYDHKVILEKDRFYIGIKTADGQYHSFHGVNRNGNVGTLLYVHPNEKGAYKEGPEYMTIADLLEGFIKGNISFDEAVNLSKEKTITYAGDGNTMQAMLSDKNGRVLIVEPGIGCRLEKERFSLITNYSLLDPDSTKPYINPGDDRYERARALLQDSSTSFRVADALYILRSVRETGKWATRVAFVYSENEHAVYYTEKNVFSEIKKYVFPLD